MPSDMNSLIERVVLRLRERGETVAFAESCTGGLLSALFTALPGVSDVFIGSVVAYSNSVKESLLKVPTELLQSVGAVSEPVAKCMAEGVRAGLQTTWAVSITGIAGPGGGTPTKPVGTVCFGLCGPEVVKAERQQLNGDRRSIQNASAEYALRFLLSELEKGE